MIRNISIFLFFLLTSLCAESEITIEKFMLYNSIEEHLTIGTIKEKDAFFEPLKSQEQLNRKALNKWIKIEFNKDMKSGKYLVSYVGFDFFSASFLKNQNFTKYVSNKKAVFSFEYVQNRDSQVYYLQLINNKKYVVPMMHIENFDVCYKDALLKPDSPYFFLLFGLIVGVIIMVSIYNLAIYYYSKEISFLYYSLMEFFMIVMMTYQMGIVSLNIHLFNASSLFSALFATLFMRSFLQTKKYLPILDKTLQFYVLLVLLDLIFLSINEYSIVMNFALYSVFGVIYFIVGFLRLRQGFLPAKFFLLGWSMLVISIFHAEHVGDFYGMSSLLFGPPLEAIFLAIGLAYKLKLLLDEKKEQEELLVHQSRLASMGEMIGNITHQWKQPLTYLSYIFMNLRETSKRNLLNDPYLNKKLDKATLQLDFMSDTIDNFKDFYLPNKIKEKFSVEEASLETVEIMEYQFKQQGIEFVMNVKSDVELNSYKNEYKQVLLNLLSNAKDIFQQRAIVNPRITLTIEKESVSVEDNAGGIDLDCINKIFEPYFTTKEGNSGIGLYMSKMIVERDMDGELEVRNKENGALFTIHFTKKERK